MMKEEINKKIYSLKTDDDVVNFVKKRIQELENNSKEKFVGQGYTTTFKEYISEKIHFKAADKIGNQECPDLVYDDITPYISLIKELRKAGAYSESTLFCNLFSVLDKYLVTDMDLFDRLNCYYDNIGKRVSIKEIKNNKCAFCSEYSGLAHNMFKFLGMDSEFAAGYRNSVPHAYLFVYPNGYQKEPVVLYDPSFYVKFIHPESKTNYSLGYYKKLNLEDFQQLKSGEPVNIDLTSTEETYRCAYKNFINNDFIFEGKNAVYSLGLEKKKHINLNTDIKKSQDEELSQK